MNKRVVLGGILAISAFFALNSSAVTFAENSTDFSITVNPSLNLRVSSPSVGFELTPRKNGTFDSASFNVYSSTNNSTGYRLIMSTDSVDLVSDTINPTIGTEPTIPTLAETAEGISASAFEASTSSDVLNHYGISIAGANYNAMKDEDEIKKTEENNVTEDTTAISLAAKLDLLTVPGVYSTTINFQIVANSTDPVQPYPEDPCIANPDCNPESGVTLQRAYEMAYTTAHRGMYEEINPGSNTYQYIDSWNGGQYQGNGRDVRFLIQDMTPEICSTATVTNSQALVLDVRDQTSYYIVKAADGRCWMQDNLALDLTNSTIQSNITNANTNADVTSLTSLFSGNRAAGDQYATAGITTWTSGYSYSVPMIYTALKDDTYSSDDIEKVRNSKYGIYYNYCAASAGSYCYGNGSSTGAPVDRPNTAIDAEYDICPSGWRMPTGYSYDATARPDGGEYQALYTAYNSSGTSFRSALLLPFSGYFDFPSGSAGYQDSNGYFWSSTRGYDGSCWDLYVDSSTTIPQHIYTTLFGFSIRCVAKTGTEPAPSGN